MRTTLEIDDDVLDAAKELSRLQRRSAGKVVSDLLRQALTGKASRVEPSAPRRRGVATGFRPFASRGAAVTNTLIDQLRDTESA